MKTYKQSIDLESISNEFGVSKEWLEDKLFELRSEQVIEEEDGLNELLSFLDYDDGEFCSSSSMFENSIYNVDDEVEIQLRINIDQKRINDGSADVEDFETLQKQAEDYFKSPDNFSIKEDVEIVTGYLFAFSGKRFNEAGELVDQWSNIGVRFEITAKDLGEDYLLSEVRRLGFNIDQYTSVRLYGSPLSRLVGSRPYSKGESKELVELYPGVFAAVPEESSCPDDSIFESLNGLVKDANKYGRHPSEILGQSAYNHWVTTLGFLESERPNYNTDKELSLSSKKVLKFKDNFAEEVQFIRSLNSGEKNLDLTDKLSLRFIQRVLYVCRSDDFSIRIETPSIYRALVARQSSLTFQEVSDSAHNAGVIINQLEQGLVNVDEISSKEVETIIKLLWSGAARLSDKSKYFQLKSRYKQIQESIKFFKAS